MDHQKLIRQITGINEAAMFDLVLESGEKYLQRHLNGDELGFKRLSNSGVFWNWWKKIWEHIDYRFIHINKELVGSTLEEIERQVIQDRYIAFLNQELGQPYLNHSFIDIKIRYAGFSEQPTMLAIIQQVAWQMDVSKMRMLGKSRERKVTEARHLAAYLMREAGYTFNQIARSLKRNHHTTIMSGVDRAKALIETDKYIFSIHNLIKSNLWQAEEQKQESKA